MTSLLGSREGSTVSSLGPGESPGAKDEIAGENVTVNTRGGIAGRRMHTDVQNATVNHEQRDSNMLS